MIVTGYYMTRKDGVRLNKTYSDVGMMLERDGSLYSEAIDPKDSGRVYVETDIPIETEKSENEPTKSD